EPISGGDKIRKGEHITLVLGRESNARTYVPSLMGATWESAVRTLNAESLNPGVVLECTGCHTPEDSLKAVVVRQYPREGSHVALGTYIDLQLSADSTLMQVEGQPRETHTDVINLEESLEIP